MRFQMLQSKSNHQHQKSLAMFRCPKIQFRSKLCVTCIRSLPNLSHRCAFGAQLLTVIGFASLTPLFESEGALSSQLLHLSEHPAAQGQPRRPGNGAWPVGEHQAPARFVVMSQRHLGVQRHRHQNRAAKRNCQQHRVYPRQQHRYSVWPACEQPQRAQPFNQHWQANYVTRSLLMLFCN